MANPWLRRSGYAVIVLVLGPIAYFAAAFGLGAVAVAPHADDRAGSATIDIAITSDGIHTDLILPIDTATVDWRRYFSPMAAPAAPDALRYVAIGWGHRGFYLNTPTWAELELKTALSAILGVGRTVLHVTFLEEAPVHDEIVWTRISPQGYARLATHVRQSIAIADTMAVHCGEASGKLLGQAPDDCGRAEQIPGHSYYGNDAFFEAGGNYHLFYTCNSWTRDALAAAGLTVPLWSPFAEAILRHLGTETR